MTELRGITWNHTRGFLPMVATAQRYSERHPGINIHWEKRSLQHFADFPISQLAEKYDLLVLDHPSIGMAAENGLLLPLDTHLEKDFLADQAKNSVGASHRSYEFTGHQWALAIDAATPISGWREDLMEKQGLTVPKRWEELIELAGRGVVAVPGIPIDSLMHFFMLCVGLGEEPFITEGKVVSNETGVRALEMLRELYTLVSPQCAQRNPIATWELLTATDEAAYCPFAYGYSNYSRERYARHSLKTGGLIAIDSKAPCRSTLGGAGLAISSRCREVETAVAYAHFVAGAECQRGLYFAAGGQPGHRQAWEDDAVNQASNDFFRNTLTTLDQAWLRPRWNGYLEFQDEGGPIVHRYLWHGGKATDVFSDLQNLANRSTKLHATRSFT
jgi:multiple sugar transport system substrate-binding protein